MTSHARASARTRAATRLGVALVVPALLLLAGCTRFGASLDRAEDPVVLTGAELPKLTGAAPGAIVAFAYDGGAWHPIPVQVDERDYVNPSTVLHRSTPAMLAGTTTPFTVLTYTEPDPALAALGYSWVRTYVPRDSDPTVDANDEVTFLANDTGKTAGSGVARPGGVDVASETRVTVNDPLAPAQNGVVYLFRATSASPVAAGTTGVHYTFSLDSGDYLATYNMQGLAPNDQPGPNPEHSTVVTPTYSLGFSDRWLNDSLAITAGGASGVDVLERIRAQFPGTCGRSEDTFDAAEGAFFANISGPVRAIRSQLGANSGPYTAQTLLFYPQRADELIDLRVHAIPGVEAFDDMQTGVPLTYSDDLAPGGVPIDGTPDTLPSGVPQWQMVSSASAGSVVTTRAVATDVVGLTMSRYYLDQNPASPAPCTGDAAAWGQNGVAITSALPCTDPTLCTAVNHLNAQRVRYFEGSGLAGSRATFLAGHARAPLSVSVG